MELLAVVVVILVLAGISLGLSRIANRQMATGLAKSQIAALAGALESYKSDWGSYPASAPVRVSYRGWAELSNSWCLASALGLLNNGSKKYLTLPSGTIRTNIVYYYNSAACLTNFLPLKLPAIMDPFGKPYNYYCSPRTSFAVMNVNQAAASSDYDQSDGYLVGGQVNGATFDLWSYGSDHVTTVPGNAWGGPWGSGNPAADDIGNFQR